MAPSVGFSVLARSGHSLVISITVVDVLRKKMIDVDVMHELLFSSVDYGSIFRLLGSPQGLVWTFGSLFSPVKAAFLVFWPFDCLSRLVPHQQAFSLDAAFSCSLSNFRLTV